MKKNSLIQQKRSKIHNRGLFAAKDIAADTPIIEYLGNKLTNKQADQHSIEHGEALIYLFQLNQRYVLDGDIDNNPAKYINHSCNPNCYAMIKAGRVWIHARRDIKKGEELSYDYGFTRPGWSDRPCFCGAKNCFGFVVVRSQWASIRRTKRYQEYLAKGHVKNQLPLK